MRRVGRTVRGMARFLGWSVGMKFCSIIARNVGFSGNRDCVARLLARQCRGRQIMSANRSEADAARLRRRSLVL